MQFHITNSQAPRKEFIWMPGLMRPLWDLYWTAIDMNGSTRAKNAVAKTQTLLRENERSPPKDALMQVILLYGGLRTLEGMVESAIQLSAWKCHKARIELEEGEDLYSGKWFANMQDKWKQWREANK